MQKIITRTQAGQLHQDYMVVSKDMADCSVVT